MAYSNRAQLHMLAEECEPAMEWGARALALAVELGCEPVVVSEQDRAAYGEAIATATEFSSALVRQSAQLLRGIGIDAPGRYLGTLVHSTIDRALTESGAEPLADELG